VRATCSRGCDNANGFEPRIMSRVDCRMSGDGMQVAGKTVWIRNHVCLRCNPNLTRTSVS
jgi:hypothetical protein